MTVQDSHGSIRRTALLLVIIPFSLAGCSKQRVPSPTSNTSPATSTPRSVEQPSASTANRGDLPQTAVPLSSRSPLEHLASAWAADQTCAECHAEIVSRYASHSMGRSMGPAAIIAHGASVPSANGGTVGSFDADGFRYEVRQDEEQLVHIQTRVGKNDEPVDKIEQPVAYRVGAGDRGQSFLVDHDGFLFMSPITYYPQRGRWALSPGFEVNNSQFNRPVPPSCLFCHANRELHDEGSRNHYKSPTFVGQAIGCQRCHGAAEQHVRFQGGTLPKNASNVSAEIATVDPIVNPAKLSPELREAVCQQCHLSGAVRVLRPGRNWHDYQPGTPLDSVFVTYVPTSSAPDGQEDFVGQVEQMYASRCFQGSDGKMGCISCHDPHSLPAPSQRVEFYRDRCLTCHHNQGCALAEEERADESNNCIACHMPAQRTEVQHAATSNHRVIRARDASRKGRGGTASAVATRRLMLFSLKFSKTSSGEAIGVDEMERNTAMANVMLADDSSGKPEMNTAVESRRALSAWVKTHPDDYDAREALAQVCYQMGEAEAAMEQLTAILRAKPDREFSLVLAAELSSGSNQIGVAATLWHQAVQRNPWMTRYWYQWSVTLARMGNWSACLQSSQRASERFPTSIGARQMLVESLLQLGRKEEAAEEFEKLRAHNPVGFDKLEQWYQDHPRR